MFYHICKKELCPHCYQMSCGCEQLFENIKGFIGHTMLCPHCRGIMSQTTITTTNTNILNQSHGKDASQIR